MANEEDGAVFEALNRLPPIDFESLLAEHLRERFQFPVANLDGHDIGADFRVDAPSPIYVEAKRIRLATDRTIQQASAVKQQIAKFNLRAGLLLIVSGEVSPQARQMAQNDGIDLLDGRALAAELSPALRDALLGRRPPAPSDRTVPKKGEWLRNRLEAIPKGSDQWPQYQAWVSEVLDHLFRPPLGEPFYESADALGKNRRDIVIENAAPTGFWSMVRLDYRAHYVVFDAKNHKDGPNKKSVLEIAHYLKPYGCGMFGILFGRTAMRSGAQHAVREQWIGNGKMILAVSDAEVIEMLQMRGNGEDPSELLRKKVTRFRLSL